MFKKKVLGYNSVRYTDVIDGKMVSTVDVKEIKEGYWARLGDGVKQVFYVENFTVVQRQRRKGYGKKLLNHLKECYKGCVLCLQVYPYNNSSMDEKQLIEYYRSNGFKDICPEWYNSNYCLMYINL